MAPTVGLRLHAQARGELTFQFCEQESAAPLITRVKILSSTGQPQRVRGALHQQGWNLFEGPLTYTGRIGDYTYQASHGPQFSAASGGFTLDLKSQGVDVIQLPRKVDLALEGWVGGDLLSQVDADESLRWLAAEDLTLTAIVVDHVTAVDQVPAQPAPSAADQPEILLTSSDPARWVHDRSYWDARGGSGLVLHHWLPPAEVPAELPSSRLLVLAKGAARRPPQLPVHAEIQNLCARDVPIWLASGKIDSVQLLGSHLTVDGQRASRIEPMIEPEPGRFRGPLRDGRLVEYVYWQMLECGLYLPPTAGSNFGKNASPLGYNRVYAYAPHPTPEAWWQAVCDGQSFVTNGPLLRATVNGEIPGKRFVLGEGSALELEIGLSLTVADPVEYLEVVFNGQTLYRARLDEYARAGGRIPPLSVKESGWLLVRVVTERDTTYRLATTAPFIVQVGERGRISGGAVAFFQAWLEKSAEQIAASSPEASAAAAPYVTAARQFWKQRAEKATVP